MSKRNGNTGLKALAAIMSGLFILLAVAGVVAYFSDWFTNWDKFKIEQGEPTEETADGGMLIGESEGVGVSLLSEKIAKADYAANGVSPLAESAYTLTATITPSDATNKEVDWSIAFVNPSSSWATGKTVTDYVTVTPTSDGALTATIQCLQAFGEQVSVTVTSRDYSEIKANCSVDFAKKISSISSLKIGGLSMSDGKFFNYFSGYDGEGSDITATPVLTEGSITDVFSYKATMCINKAVSDALIAQDFTVTKTVGEYFDIGTTNALISNAIDRYGLVVQGPKRAAFMNAMRTLGTGAEIGSIKLVCTGSYSTFEKIYPIVLDSSCTVLAVSGIQINESTLVF